MGPTKLYPLLDFSLHECGASPSVTAMPTRRRSRRTDENSSPDATRGSHSNSMRRYSHSCTKHRHSDSHCCCPDTAHGLGRLCLDAAKIVYFFQIYAKNKKNRPPKAVFVHTRHRQVDFDFIALRFYATSTVALYLATLDALTILPRKARRDPRYATEYDAS